MTSEKVAFTKMQGNGNDFIVIDNREGRFSGEALSDLALSLCRRRISIGADGLMAVELSARGDFRMRLFNCDGSEGEMCGNGARCLARYAFERGIAPNRVMIDTLAGLIGAEVAPPYATLDMGTLKTAGVLRNQTFVFEGEPLRYSQLVVGVPHTVVFQEAGDERTHEELAPAARAFQGDRMRFPHSTNVNFLKITGPSGLDLRTYERGVGDFTLSCGTGSTAGAAAAWIEGLVKPPVAVQNPGGVNTVLIDEEKPGLIRLHLKGLTVFVAEGTVCKS
ncbi:MAG: diaminopimelate epimerase [Thermovirgaceae bacterium]|nr:diaminopimelate epimerase [Thermovirgaceae bacterium]